MLSVVDNVKMIEKKCFLEITPNFLSQTYLYTKS